MQFFRRMVRTKIGGYLALGLLLLLGFAFAAADMSGSVGSMLGQNSAQVAKISGDTITANDLQTRTQRFFERVRQEQPELTMAEFLAQGGMQQVLDEMISVKALIAYGQKHGVRISKKLVDAEIARTPAFADATGVFSETQFRSILSQNRVSEQEVREDFTGQIIRQHLLMAAAAGARTPETMVPPYAAMLIELREGEMFAVPSQRFAPEKAPTDAQLRAFYTANPDEFALPEQRKLRYVLLSRERFDAQAAPTEAEIADAYKARAKEFAASQARDLSQLILPTEAQAKDFAAKAAGGKTLADLAREAGLSASRTQAAEQAAIASQTSADAAKAAFAAGKGQLVGPFRTALGWALIHVDDIRSVPGKALEQVRPELTAELRERKAKELFADFVNQLDGRLGEGATLTDLAKENDLQIAETPLLTGEGRNLRDPAYQADETVQALLKPGFAMSGSDDPQIVPVKPDEQIAILIPGDTVAAGPPPLTEVREAAVLAWRLSQGAAKAREAANKASALMNKGVAPEEALKQAGIAGLPRQPLAVRRIQLNQQTGAPPPLRALLTMQVNSARVVAMENNLGFVVVRLAKVTPEDPRPNTQLMDSTRAGLANVLGNEYMTQLIGAIERDLKVSRNLTAIAAVEKALREANGLAQ